MKARKNVKASGIYLSYENHYFNPAKRFMNYSLKHTKDWELTPLVGRWQDNNILMFDKYALIFSVQRRNSNFAKQKN